MIIIWHFLQLHSPKIGVREGLKKVDWWGSFFAVYVKSQFFEIFTCFDTDRFHKTQSWHNPVFGMLTFESA